MHQSYSLAKRSVPHKAPLLGYVSAGNPLDPAPYLIRRRFTIPPGLRRFGMFSLQVTGDSMTLEDGTGLIDGCFVLVDGHDVMSDRGHVFAFRLQDGSYVVKRYKLHQGHMVLHSDNPAHEPILLNSSIRCQGRVYAASADGKNWTRLKYWLPN